MIETLKTSVELVWALIQYSLFVSYKIGFFLVNILSTLQKNLTKLIYVVVDFIGAVFESFTTFCQDIIQDFQGILKILSSVDVLQYLSDFKNIFHSGIFIVKSLSDFIITIVLSVVIGVQTILLSPKYVLLFFIQNLSSATSCIKQTFIDVTAFFHEIFKWVLQNLKSTITTITSFWVDLPRTTYNLITDTPIESIICIMISSCLTYLFVRFYIIIFSFLYRQLKRLFCNIQRKYIGLQRYFGRRSMPGRVIYRRQMLPRRRPNIRTEEQPTINLPKSEENDRYCVICQEQIKCVLLLPCRHLCMCNQCIGTLQTYNNTCPICRANIESTMQIFV